MRRTAELLKRARPRWVTAGAIAKRQRIKHTAALNRLYKLMAAGLVARRRAAKGFEYEWRML